MRRLSVGVDYCGRNGDRFVSEWIWL